MFDEMSDGELGEWIMREGLRLAAEKVAATSEGISVEAVLVGLHARCTEQVIGDLILSQRTTKENDGHYLVIRLLHILASDSEVSRGRVISASRRGGARKRQ